MLARLNFDGENVCHNRRTVPQDAQKVRPARPQRVKDRGVPSGVPGFFSILLEEVAMENQVRTAEGETKPETLSTATAVRWTRSGSC